MLKRIYINEDACIGCGLCKVYCVAEHSRAKDIIKAHKREVPKPVPRVRIERKADVAFSLQCRHCSEPWCVYSCLTGAMQKDPVTGLVKVDQDKCMGCWTCILACPHGAIVRDQGKKTVAKCDFCPDRDMPACVANCPNEALMVVEENDFVKSGSPDLPGKK
jgi:carbon-monoxide dehydrogenase iron sulfur subunit